MDAEAILADISQMLTDVIGEDYLLDVSITRDSTFAYDLELESVEFVALTGLMRQRYGSRVDFVGFLADMTPQEIIDLCVGQVVDHVERCLSVVHSRG